MTKFRAVATWTREESWDIVFPDGVARIQYAATNTGEHPTTVNPPNTKAQAEELARDYVSVALSWGAKRDVEPEDIDLTIKWENERNYQRWYERTFGESDPY